LSGDGCSASCRTEPGWDCPVPGQPCNRFEVFIDSPAHGVFTTAGSATITGHYTTLLPNQAGIFVNGVPASSVNRATRTFSHTLALDAAAVFNPVDATLT